MTVLQTHLPSRWLKALESFRNDSATLTRTDDWHSMTKSALIRIFANTVVVIAIFLLADKYIQPALEKQLDLEGWSNGLSLLLVMTMSAPFLWAIAFGKINEAETQLWNNTTHLVVGIEKDGKRILNPDSALLIEPGDILWVVGNRQLLQRFSFL